MRVFDFRLRMDIKEEEKRLNWLDKSMLQVYKNTRPGCSVDAFDLAIVATLFILIYPLILFLIVQEKYYQYKHKKRMEYWRIKFDKLFEEIAAAKEA